MLKFVLLIVSTYMLHAISITQPFTNTLLLPQSHIYIDHSQKETIDTIKTKTFHTIDKDILSFGYSPDFHVWLHFNLYNDSNSSQEYIIEYGNSLSSTVRFYDGTTSRLLKEVSLFSSSAEQLSLNPTLTIKLQAYENKDYYLLAYTQITTLIVQTKLYTPKSFYQKEIKHQFILALFFGVMGIAILYNLIVFIKTGDRSYLYYVLFFISITFHHLLYRGIGHLYLFSETTMRYLIQHAAFITLMPAVFLALFMKEILHIKTYPHIHRLLLTSLILCSLFVVIFYLYGMNNYRNLPTLGLLFVIFVILCIMVYHRDHQAYYLMFGWTLFILSAVAMQLSSMGKYEIFTTFPYFSEFSLVLEAILFSLILSNKLKELTLKKIDAQQQLLNYQNKEEVRLTHLVEEKTHNLQKALEEKQLLLKELNHRVKNNLQTILSFIRLQKNKTSHSPTLTILQSLQNRIFSIDRLHTLLNKKQSVSTIDAHTYFTQILQYLQESFAMPHIKTSLDTVATLSSHDAIYCGSILNEAVTNAYQHAFSDTLEGEIYISLKQVGKEYIFIIKDTGIGYDINKSTNSLGLRIINTIVTIQLEGILSLDVKHGTILTITWKEKKHVS